MPGRVIDTVSDCYRNDTYGVIMRSTDAAAKFVIIVAINALASVRSLINSIFVVIIRTELSLFLASR